MRRDESSYKGPKIKDDPKKLTNNLLVLSKLIFLELIEAKLVELEDSCF